jgi:spermidine synthase
MTPFLKQYFPLAVFLLTWPFKLKRRRKLIYCQNSSLQKISVSDQAGLRSLQLGEGDNPIQSCISLKNPNTLILSCSQLMLAALYLNASPRKILIIGLGGGVLSRSIAQLLPQSDITNVEIDPLVVQVAQNYFHFTPDSQQHITIDDGRNFIEKELAQGQQYDLIMLDAYDDQYIPTRLMTLEFLQSVKALLSEEGVLAANTFSVSALYDRESATYAAVFGKFYYLTFNNRIILAQKKALPSLATIKERAKNFDSQFKYFGVNTQRLKALLTISGVWDPLALPLKD